MISSLMGMLTKRKQAYLGKPASAMTWDPVKKRYVFEGESESEEEIVKPPPVAKKEKAPEEEKPKEEPKKEVSGANAFTQVAFGGVRVNRGRDQAKGGRPGPTAQRTAPASTVSTFVPTSPAKTELVAQKEELKQE